MDGHRPCVAFMVRNRVKRLGTNGGRGDDVRAAYESTKKTVLESQTVPSNLSEFSVTQRSAKALPNFKFFQHHSQVTAFFCLNASGDEFALRVIGQIVHVSAVSTNLSMANSVTTSRLEELRMIQCSLLAGERLEFKEDEDFWNPLIADAVVDADVGSLCADERFLSATFTLKVDNGVALWFRVTMPIGSTAATVRNGSDVVISPKGENMSRAEQERWQRVVDEKRAEVDDVTDFQTYQLISIHLLPLLHVAQQQRQFDFATEEILVQMHATAPSQLHHVLFTSHHLISPKKRRSLQQWSSSLSVAGFGKVGYPGAIYAQGLQEDIEEFTSNVKAMQWLALKVRFMEPVPDKYLESIKPSAERLVLEGWTEFQRVGEVVEEMRRLGREEYVLEMGIGSVAAG